MKAFIFSFTTAGTQLGLRIGTYLAAQKWDVTNETLPKLLHLDTRLQAFPLNLQEAVRLAMKEAQALIFVGAAAIAIRMTAPHLRGKEKDPAVLVIDEKGQFVIPLLAGHIGGANGLARMLAAMLHGQAVITTATDVNDLFAVDEWAARQGLHLSSLQDAKQFAAELLERGQAGLYSEFPVGGEMPAGLIRAQKGPVGVAVTVHEDCHPFTRTITAYPVILHIGIGCKRGTSREQIARRVEEDMKQIHVSWQAVADISTIDIKRNEAGLTAFAEQHHLPIQYYTVRQLNDAPGTFMSSDFVRRIIGTDNVCERAAVLASHGGTLLLQKSGKDGVTVAIACEPYTVTFDKKR